MAENLPESPILSCEGVLVDPVRSLETLSLELFAGELLYLPFHSVYKIATGVSPLPTGTVCYLGKPWTERTNSELEADRRTIGFVANPDLDSNEIWLSNLEINENVILGANFDRSRSTRSILQKVNELTQRFGLIEGLPQTRESDTPIADSICAQWVRAFLPKDLKLLILENPIQYAPDEDVPAFLDAVRSAMENGTAVVWVTRKMPDFAKLGLEPKFLMQGV